MTGYVKASDRKEKHMKRKSFSLFLAMLLLLGSCSNTPAENEKPETNAPVPETALPENETETETEETTLLPPELTGIVFNGEDFSVLYRMDTYAYNLTDLFMDDLVGEVWSDAVYNRNLTMEDTFDIKFKQYPSTSAAADFKTDCLGGLHSYEVAADQFTVMMPMALENFCYDWNDLTYVNTDDPWFDSNIKRDLILGNKLYAMSGNVSIYPTFFSRFVYFSKGVLDDFNLTAPYDLVREGKWTIDKMIEMVTAVSKDVNGDGQFTADDTLGHLTEDFSFYLVGCGVRYTEPDENGIPAVTGANERTLTALEKVKTLMTVPDSTASYWDAASGKDTSGYAHLYDYVRYEYFTTEHFLFTQTDADTAPQFVDMPRGFGVLPNPKLDENQKDYYHPVDQYTCAWFIPSDSNTIEKTDILFTAWNCLSRDVIDAYYEQHLKFRRMDSPDDVEMLDLIHASSCYEVSWIIDIGVKNMYSMVYENGNLMSTYDRMKKQIDKLITKKIPMDAETTSP